MDKIAKNWMPTERIRSFASMNRLCMASNSQPPHIQCGPIHTYKKAGICNFALATSGTREEERERVKNNRHLHLNTNGGHCAVAFRHICLTRMLFCVNCSSFGEKTAFILLKFSLFGFHSHWRTHSRAIKLKQRIAFHT